MWTLFLLHRLIFYLLLDRPSRKHDRRLQKQAALSGCRSDSVWNLNCVLVFNSLHNQAPSPPCFNRSPRTPAVGTCVQLRAATLPFQWHAQPVTVLAASPSLDRPHGTRCRHRYATANFRPYSVINQQESPANAKGTRDSSACMKAHCEQM